MKKFFAKFIKTTSILILSLLLFGSVYESCKVSSNFRNFPPPGKMISLKDGRKIQLDCRGKGSPIVVFESGGDTFGSMSWYSAHNAAAKYSRACVYSRSGIMWSDRRSGKTAPRAIADDLYNLLAKAGERPPYILVGHSMGGGLITLFSSC